MKKEKYEAPTVEVIGVCHPMGMLVTLSMEGNVEDYEGAEFDDF